MIGKAHLAWAKQRGCLNPLDIEKGQAYSKCRPDLRYNVALFSNAPTCMTPPDLPRPFQLDGPEISPGYTVYSSN